MRRERSSCRWNGFGLKSLGASFLALALPVCGWAQQAGDVAVASLPSAPVPQMSSQLASSASSQVQTASQSSPGTPASLSVKDAQTLALKNNPQISVARLNALASLQVTREVRSSLWPTAQVDLTAVDTNPGNRITAGALNNPTVYQRAAAGASVSQLLTDFGRYMHRNHERRYDGDGRSPHRP